MSRTKAGWCMIALLLCTFGVGFWAGHWITQNRIYQEAIDANRGEYYLDEDHNRKFRFLDPNSNSEVESGVKIK